MHYSKSLRTGAGNHFRLRATLHLYMSIAVQIFVKKDKFQTKKLPFAGRMWFAAVCSYFASPAVKDTYNLYIFFSAISTFNTFRVVSNLKSNYNPIVLWYTHL